MALSVYETLGGKVITTDAQSWSQSQRPSDDHCAWIINTGTRALSPDEAQARSRDLATRSFPGDGNLPLVQIDSRLRGTRNAVKGLYESLDFDYLLFVPAEPELGRLVQQGDYYHVEDARLVPFHRSILAKSAERPLENSDLRAFMAGELGIGRDRVVSIDAQVVSKGAEAVVEFIRGLRQQRKCVLIPDVATAEHFEVVVAATRQLRQEKILLAGSRTFLRSLLVSFAPGIAELRQRLSLSEAIDCRRRGAPLAIVCSLEPATNSQIEYVQRALGPNLVTVVFDSEVIQAGGEAIRREVECVRQLTLRSLKAMRPVLLHSARAGFASDPAARQAHLDALGQVVAAGDLGPHMSALFLCGGQTAETIRSMLGILSIEIKGAFQDSIPWGKPLEGSFKEIPIVTKGGRLGSEAVLFEFFEQGHPLPRANVLPVVTPLTSDKRIDESGIERLIRHLVRLGTTDVFAVGNAGEFRFLANEARLQVIEVFARKARGQLRVFAGITGDTPEETRRNYEAASRLGVFAAVIMPLYFLKSSEEIVPFVRSLAAIGSGLPLVLYNNPERTGGQHISFEAVEALEFPVVAIKDSSGDFARFDRYAAALPVYQGQQRLFLEGYQHGARGTVGIIGHVSALPNEFYGPETTGARRGEIARCINDLSKQVKQGGAEVAAYKFLLSLMGVMGDTVASSEAARELTASST